MTHDSILSKNTMSKQFSPQITKMKAAGGYERWALLWYMRKDFNKLFVTAWKWWLSNYSCITEAKNVEYQ